MRTRNVTLGATLAMILVLTNTSHALLMSSTDLWDVSQGTTVTSSSFVGSGGASNMFGASDASAEKTNTIFCDSYNTGYVHWIEWQTITAVTIDGFNLVASHDQSPRNANERGFSRFSLYAKVSDNWVELYTYYPTNPYGGGENYAGLSVLELCAPVTETTAQYFRAEFVQYGDRTAAAKGPRVWELDGYGIPEPATLSLLAIGTAALLRKKR